MSMSRRRISLGSGGLRLARSRSKYHGTCRTATAAGWSKISGATLGKLQHASRRVDGTMKASVFVGTSVDGFIARPNGALDFLPEGGGEPHGYDEFMASVDALVIGRKTYETVLGFGAWPYGDKRVVVLSSRPVDLSAVRGGVVEQMAGPPEEIVAKLPASGAEHLYVDGGITIQAVLRAGLIQTLLITPVPGL